MSTSAQERAIPALTLGWRLQMAMRHGGVTRDAMAEYLGVSPSTISRWNGDKGDAPKRAYLAQWALLTGVDLGWLTDGTDGGPAPTPGPGIDPDPRIDTEALAKLTARKRAGSRHAGRSTQQYPQAA